MSPPPRLVTSSGLRALSTSTVRPSSEQELEVNIPMIRKMERICRSTSVLIAQIVVFNTIVIAGIILTSWSSPAGSSTTSRTS